jgi:small subunit ribosomal protein S17
MADENENEQEPQDAAPETSETPEADVATGETERAAAEESEGGSAVVRRRKRTPKPVVRAREPRTPEERHAERVATRRAKALARRARRSQEREKAASKQSTATSTEDLPPVHAAKRGAPKERQGIVVSSKPDKTITVRIDVARQHRRYGKIVRSSGTLHAHDEGNDANEGDVVRIVESRPLSKTKRWRLVDVLERAR